MNTSDYQLLFRFFDFWSIIPLKLSTMLPSIIGLVRPTSQKRNPTEIRAIKFDET